MQRRVWQCPERDRDNAERRGEQRKFRLGADGHQRSQVCIGAFRNSPQCHGVGDFEGSTRQGERKGDNTREMLLRRGLSSAAVRAVGRGAARQVLKLDKLAPLAASLGPSDVSIKMLVAPIHPMDIQMVESASGALPSFLGVEGLAEVSAVGSGVTSLRKGDWVVPQLGFGASTKTPDTRKNFAASR